jgi:MFS family permease
VTPLYGELPDIHGRRPVLLAGIAIFVAGSIACALSPTMTALILSRALQGLGGGGLISVSHAIIGDAVAPRERGRYQGYFGALFATASIAGPVLGGVFSDHLHWTLIFWINVPLGALAFGFVSHALKALPRNERPHTLDLLGAALMVAATICFLLALNWGGVRYAWSSTPILALLGGTFVLFVLFAFRLATAPEPFVPLTVLSNGVVAVAVTAASFAYGTMIALTIYTPVYFEAVLGQSASLAGLTLIPFMGGVVLGSTSAGRLMSRLKHYKRITLVGLPFAFAALLPMVLVPQALSIGMVGPLLLIAGAGLGTVLPITTVSVQNAVALHELGTATGLVNFMRALASALLVALYGAILFGGVSGASGVTLETLSHNASPELALHFRYVFAVAAFCLALSFFFLLAMEERPLRATVAHEPDPIPVPAE